jgi:hypothetical protein
MTKPQPWNTRSLNPQLRCVLFTSGLLLAGAGSAPAEVHYVGLNSTNATPPYTNWTTAATNIQDAVDAAVAGDEVVVTNGTYATGGRTNSHGLNRVLVDKALSLRSVNGPQVTTISGGNNCAYLTNGATFSGCTLTHGGLPGILSGISGRGVWCESASAVVSNCVITGNYTFASSFGYGGGAFGGTLNNCTLTGNLVINSSTYGGGAARCTLNNCVLSGNSAGFALGGPFLTYGFGGGAAFCTLNNCTLTRNSVSSTASVEPDMFDNGGGTYQCTLRNCILTENWVSDHWFGQFENNYSQSTSIACWTGDPLFVDRAGGNLRLQSNSPCINAGDNVFAFTGPDLDGNPRIIGGTVDIGAYEFQSPVSQISYAWLQQYGLPIDSSTDTADPDGDGVDNYHEWLAGTNPTNALSSPAQLTITPSGIPPSGIILTWSTNAVGFTVQSTTNPLSPAFWVTNSPAPVVIYGQNTVTNPISGAQQFYRLIH